MDFLDSLNNAWADDPVETTGADGSVSPHLGALIRAVRGYEQEQVTEDQVQQEILEMAARLEAALHDHETLCGAAELPEEIRALAERSREGYHAFAAGLEQIRTALELCEPLDPGLEVCRQAALLLDEQHRGVAELRRRDSQGRCLMCSHVNPASARQCARCGAVLPGQMERSSAAVEPAASDLVMVPPEYVELYNACDAVAAGRIEVAEWRRAVSTLGQAFSQTRDNVSRHLARHSQDLEGAPELRPVAESMMDGLGRAEAALEEMGRFEGDGDPEHLNQGWLALLKGTRKVQESGAIFLSALEASQRAAAEAASASQ